MADIRLYDLKNITNYSGDTSILIDDPNFDVAKKTTIDDLKNYFFTKSTIIYSDYIVLKNDFILIVSGNTDTINLTFPLIQNANQSGYIIKNVGYSAINLLTTELIDGYSEVTISYHNTSITLKPISDQWYIF